MVTCVTSNADLTADPGVARLILARSHTFLDIDYRLISMVILPPADLFKKVCCQLLAEECARIAG